MNEENVEKCDGYEEGIGLKETKTGDMLYVNKVKLVKKISGTIFTDNGMETGDHDTTKIGVSGP